MPDPNQPFIAVAYLVDSEGRLLLAWNNKWGAFSLPMTKIRTEWPDETPDEAAVRAAAEILGVPARVAAGKTTQFSEHLAPSLRDQEIKDYKCHIVPVEVHPDFDANIRADRAWIWADVEKLQQQDYQPVSPSVAGFLKDAQEWGWL